METVAQRSGYEDKSLPAWDRYSSECPLCLEDIEDTQHLFRWCPLAIEASAHRQIRMDPSTGNDSLFREWLSYWLIYFNQEDGCHGSRIPAFVNTLWAIWRSPNEQVFWHRRPTRQSICIQLQDSDNQHDIFITPMHDPSRNPRDPNIPPGFHCAHLSQKLKGDRPLLVQIDVSWDKVRNSS